MNVEIIQTWIEANPYLALAATIVGLVIIYLVSRLIFGRGLTYIASITKNKWDDIIIAKMKPFRASLLIPFIVIFLLAYLSPQYKVIIEKVALFFIIWIAALTIIGLLGAVNIVYEKSSAFKGVSIQGYLDLLKIFILAVSIILTISVISGRSPVLLLSGLGAITALLLFVFQDTISSFIASIQISLNDLVKEGDWLEVPTYDADGIVTNVSLYMIRIKNWDNTTTVIPTSKLIDASYRNWRGMQESGGRRIKRSINLDQTTIHFCTPEMIERYAKIDLISDFMAKRKKEIASYNKDSKKTVMELNGPQLTNVEVFRAYVENYMNNHNSIHNQDKDMSFLVYELEPSPTGLPLEVYAFTKTTDWDKYEHIQAEIFDHLLAAAQYFDLRVFQEPAGSDFMRALKR
jgi:miniconductance mechanosensitive channel